MRKIFTFAFCTLLFALATQETYRAQILEQAGQFEDALAVYRSVLENSPKDRQALSGFIRVCRHLERYDSLVLVLRRLESKGERNFELTLGIVEGLLKTRRRQEGLARAQQLLQNSPERILEIAQVLTEGGEPVIAAQALEKVLKASEFRMDYADFLIEIYEQTGRQTDAAGVISEIVNKDERHLPRLLERLLGYGRQYGYLRVVNELGKIRDVRVRARAQAAVYLGAGEEMAAVRVVETVFSEQELYLFARDCERDGALNAALAIYLKQTAWADAARVLRQLGRVEEALKVLERDTTPAGKLEFAEIARIEQRNFKKAIGGYQEVLRRRPNDGVALYGLARALIGLRQLDSAHKVLKGINQPDAGALLLLAQVYFYQGEFDSVPKAASALSQKFPNSQLVNDGLRLALLTYGGERAKKLATAMLDYETEADEEGMKKVQELAQGSDLIAQEAYSLCARFYYRQKKYKQALTVLDTFLTRFPQGELAARIRLQQAEIYRDGLKDEAHFRLALERLIVDFPGSPYVPIARNLLHRPTAVKPGEVR